MLTIFYFVNVQCFSGNFQSLISKFPCFFIANFQLLILRNFFVLSRKLLSSIPQFQIFFLVNFQLLKLKNFLVFSRNFWDYFQNFWVFFFFVKIYSLFQSTTVLWRSGSEAQEIPLLFKQSFWCGHSSLWLFRVTSLTNYQQTLSDWQRPSFMCGAVISPC